MDKKGLSILNCQPFLNYVLTLKSQFKKQTALKQNSCSKGVKNLVVLAGGNIKGSFQSGISKAYWFFLPPNRKHCFPIFLPVTDQLMIKSVLCSEEIPLACRSSFFICLLVCFFFLPPALPPSLNFHVQPCWRIGLLWWELWDVLILVGAFFKAAPWPAQLWLQLSCLVQECLQHPPCSMFHPWGKGGGAHHRCLV